MTLEVNPNGTESSVLDRGSDARSGACVRGEHGGADRVGGIPSLASVLITILGTTFTVSSLGLSSPRKQPAQAGAALNLPAQLSNLAVDTAGVGAREGQCHA